jgi:phytoene/squalene synthetase
MSKLFSQTSLLCSEIITQSYSTSFSSAVKMLAPELRPQIHAIYGFVRLADEIVDTFLDKPQEILLDKFIEDYKMALDLKISLNPILHAFQEVVHQYHIYELVDDFLFSMRLDLTKKDYMTREEYERYIYGSADVVGLMCLKVFVEGDENKYEELKKPAMKLGSAFQKVNFLRDIRQDFESLGRSYFPNVNLNQITKVEKQEIIDEIKQDFKDAMVGIKKLPASARFGVLTAYKYYLSLLEKIEKTEPQKLLQARIRVADSQKLVILAKSYVRHQLNIL